MSLPGARTPRELAFGLLWVLALLIVQPIFPWWVLLVLLAGALAWCFAVGVREHLRGDLPDDDSGQLSLHGPPRHSGTSPPED